MSLYVDVVETTDYWSVQLIERIEDDVVFIILRDFALVDMDRKSQELVRDQAAVWGRRAARALDIKCHVRPLQKQGKRAHNQPVSPQGASEGQKEG